MSELLALATILLAVFIGAASPGPSFIFVTRTAVARSRRDGFLAALGMGVGSLVFSAAALFGLHAVFTHVAWLYVALKIVGGLYLVYLAWRLWRGAAEPAALSDGEALSPVSRGKAFATALMVQLSNPKTAIFYASIFTAMLPAQAPAWMFLALPPLVLLIEVSWYAGVVLAFSSGPSRAVYLKSKRWIDRAAGALLGVIGLRLIVSAGARSA